MTKTDSYIITCYQCGRKASQKSISPITGKKRYLCTKHLAENEMQHFYIQKKQKLPIDTERDEQEYKRKHGTELERIIYNRELSFSEKIDLIC